MGSKNFPLTEEVKSNQNGNLSVENQMKPKTFVVVGRTQHGKSTLIKYFCGLSDREIKVGKGDGVACTSELACYKAKSTSPFSGHYCMDTIGNGENRYLISYSEIRQKIENFILENTSDNGLAGIIIVESIAESGNSIRPNLENVRKIFGVFPEESILVILTKKNLVSKYSYVIKNAATQEV